MESDIKQEWAFVLLEMSSHLAWPCYFVDWWFGNVGKTCRSQADLERVQSGIDESHSMLKLAFCICLMPALTSHVHVGQHGDVTAANQLQQQFM